MRIVCGEGASQELVFGLLGLGDRLLPILLSIQTIPWLHCLFPCSDIPLAVEWALRAV
jgi:hypothetical protein